MINKQIKCYSSNHVKLVEKYAINKHYISPIILMENAAIAAMDIINSIDQDFSKKYLILCGPGNNGGDGFALARHLYSAGADIVIFWKGNDEGYSLEAMHFLKIAQAHNIKFRTFDSFNLIKPENSFVIDALFGIGLSRKIKEPYTTIIEHSKKWGNNILSIDIPSGIDSDSGNILGCSIKAGYTVTFVRLKKGLILYPGYKQCGIIYFSDLSVCRNETIIDDESIEIDIPKIPVSAKENSNKFTYGPVSVIGGSIKYRGAALFSALSSLKSGSGYVKLFTPEFAAPINSIENSQIVITHVGTKKITLENLIEHADEIFKSKSIIVGPGLGLDSKGVVNWLLRNYSGKLIIDGDGLSQLNSINDFSTDADVIITPHDGEAARLLGVKSASIRTNRCNSIKEIAEKYKCTVVLKGPHSLIYDRVKSYINFSGNQLLATAGSGDTLAGIIASRLVIESNITKAVRESVFLHGLVADIYRDTISSIGMSVMDIINLIPKAFNEWQIKEKEWTESNYNSWKYV